MLITEIFKSIQGEGTRAGLPCIFVRLTGCNLRCTWCDTAYAFHGGTRHTLDDILARVASLAQDNGHSIPLVEITGGEPLLQAETPALAQRLLDAGYTVMIETSGERPINTLPATVIKIVDVKCPDSGEPDTFHLANLDALTENDELKFVISTRRDFEFARDFVVTHKLASRVRALLFSPVFPNPNGTWPSLSSRELAEWILAEALPVRLGLQLHKFIWDPSTRGV
jgi:7-carboxy-7-deazaguanine synthase